MRFLKVVVAAKAGTTDIVNILYYSNMPSSPIGFSAADMQGLGEAVRDAWKDSVTPYLAEGYRVDVITVSQINEANQVTGSMSIQVAGAGNVGNGGPSDGRGVTIPVSFLLERVPDVNPLRVPKRSYVAIGPLGSNSVDSDGNFTPGSFQHDGIEDALTVGHLAGATLFEPYRVGVAHDDLPPAVGKVMGVRIARRISVRRSRLDR